MIIIVISTTMEMMIIDHRRDDNGDGDGVHLEALNQLVVTHQVVENPEHMLKIW